MNKLVYKRSNVLGILTYLPIVIAIFTIFCLGTYYLIFCFIKNTAQPIVIFIIMAICLFCVLPLLIALVFFFANLIEYPYIDKIKIEKDNLVFKVITHFYKTKYVNIPINEIKNININLDIAVPSIPKYKHYDHLTIAIDSTQKIEIEDYNGGTILLDSILIHQEYLPEITYNKVYKTNFICIAGCYSFVGKLILAILMYAVFIPLTIYVINIFLRAI